MTIRSYTHTIRYEALVRWARCLTWLQWHRQSRIPQSISEDGRASVTNTVTGRVPRLGVAASPRVSGAYSPSGKQMIYRQGTSDSLAALPCTKATADGNNACQTRSQLDLGVDKGNAQGSRGEHGCHFYGPDATVHASKRPPDIDDTDLCPAAAVLGRFSSACVHKCRPKSKAHSLARHPPHGDVRRKNDQRQQERGGRTPG